MASQSNARTLQLNWAR